MLRLLRNITLLVALLIGGYRLSAQELIVGADFTTLFDNREFASMELDESGTLFSARLTPVVGIEWSDYNRLMFGADLVQNFGEETKFLSDVNVQLYYTFTKTNIKLCAGIFPRAMMRGLGSPLFFDRSYRYYHNCISGVLARYEWSGDDGKADDSYVEFAMDYTGMRAYAMRESFMIMSSARYAPFKGSMAIPYCGYDLLMGHYAKDYNPETEDGVVDNILLTPHIGSTFRIATTNVAYPVLLDLRLSLVESLQRDRHYENVWRNPWGGELYLSAEWRGLSLSNRLHVGSGAPMTYYGRYGTELYCGTQHYAASNGIYNIAMASYEHRLFDDTVGIVAGITAEYDGKAWGTRQWLQVNVDLDYGIKLCNRRD